MVDENGDVIDNGFNWEGLTDFIYSVEGPTLGVISLAKGGSISQGADGTISATAGPNGTFAGPGAAGTGDAVRAAAGVSSQVVASAPLMLPGGIALSPGVLLIALAAAVGIFAIAKA